MSEKSVKLREIKDTLEVRGSIFSNHEIIALFTNVLYPSMSAPGDYPETLFRVAGSNEKVNLSVKLYGDTGGRGKISAVSIPRFAQEALTEIQDYRVIYIGEANGIYKVVEKFEEPGVYALAYRREPRFRIEVSSTNGWIAGPMTFTEYGGVSTFKHTINFEETPQIVTLETSVAQRATDDRGKLAKRLFLDFHEQLKKGCQEKGMIPHEG